MNQIVAREDSKDSAAICNRSLTDAISSMRSTVVQASAFAGVKTSFSGGTITSAIFVEAHAMAAS
jgi:hypothetical protein